MNQTNYSLCCHTSAPFFLTKANLKKVNTTIPKGFMLVKIKLCMHIIDVYFCL